MPCPPDADPTWSVHKQWSIITSLERYYRLRYTHCWYEFVVADEERLVVAFEVSAGDDEALAAHHLVTRLLGMGLRKGCVMPRTVIVRTYRRRVARGTHGEPAEPDVPEPGEMWFTFDPADRSWDDRVTPADLRRRALFSGA